MANQLITHPLHIDIINVIDEVCLNIGLVPMVVRLRS